MGEDIEALYISLHGYLPDGETRLVSISSKPWDDLTQLNKWRSLKYIRNKTRTSEGLKLYQEHLREIEPYAQQALDF